MSLSLLDSALRHAARASCSTGCTDTGMSGEREGDGGRWEWGGGGGGGGDEGRWSEI